LGYATHTDYNIICSVIEAEILRRYPFATARENSSDEVNHILWVIDSIQGLDDQREINLRVSWIIAKAHHLRLLDKNDRERHEEKALVKMDIEQAF